MIMAFFLLPVLIGVLFLVTVHFSGLKRKNSVHLVYWSVSYLIAAIFSMAFSDDWKLPMLFICSTFYVLAALVFLFQLQRKQIDLQTIKQQSLLNIFHTLAPSVPLPILHGWTITPELGSVYINEILQQEPRLIVEAGSGTSTIFSGMTCRKLGKGKVLALDHDAEYSEQTRQMIKNYQLEDWCEVKHCPLKVYDIDGQKYSWYDIEHLELADSSIDMLLVDGPFEKANKLARYPAYPLLKSKLSEKLVLVVDDAARPDEAKMVDLWLKDLKGYGKTSHQSEKGLIVVKPASGL